jgi:hypothetical protein
MMKRITLALLAAAAIGCAAIPAWAGNGAPSGPHFNVNIIGVKKGAAPSGSETSSGHSIFIPLNTTKLPRNWDGATCTTPDGTQTDFVDEDGPTFSTQEPDGGTRIYFHPTTTGSFEITDRDAVDGEAHVTIPVEDTEEKWVLVDLWVRVLGKPGGCAEISGYAYEDPADGDPNELWWYSGSILMNRTGGKSSFVDATDIFEVDYCNVDTVEGELQCTGPTQSLSVFNDIFDEYFWEVNNKDTRLIQLRFYPRQATQ